MRALAAVYGGMGGAFTLSVGTDSTQAVFHTNIAMLNCIMENNVAIGECISLILNYLKQDDQVGFCHWHADTGGAISMTVGNDDSLVYNTSVLLVDCSMNFNKASGTGHSATESYSQYVSVVPRSFGHQFGRAWGCCLDVYCFAIFVVLTPFDRRLKRRWWCSLLVCR